MNGYNLSIEGIRKGVLLLSNKRVRGWTSGRRLPIENFVKQPSW